MNNDTFNISEEEIKRLSTLTRLDEASITQHVQSLPNILHMIQQINACDTSQVTPMASPFTNASTPLRADNITATDERKVLQPLAASVMSGLYLVPKVIE